MALHTIVEHDSTHIKPYIDAVKETFTKNGAHNLLPMTLASIKPLNTSGTWSGNTYTQNGVTYTIDTDTDGNITGITANGTATGSYSGLYVANFVPPTGYYIKTGCPSGGSVNTYVFGGSSGNDTGNGLDYYSDGSTTKAYVIAITSGYTANNLVFKPMLRLASDTDTTFEPYAMTNRELTNVVQAEARISATNRAWPGDTLTFKNLPKSNGRWYEFTACISYDAARFLKGFITLREDNAIIVNGKQGDFTVAYNQDGDLVITLPISSHWLYDMRRSGELN